MRTHRVALVVSIMAGLLVAGAALAWACTAQAYITIHPSQGEAGSEVTVDGRYFTKDVKIRWNGEQGPLLATAEGGSFQKKVTIPSSANDGHYSIVAVGYDEDGEVAGRSSASFTVTSSSSAGQSGDGDGQPEGNQQTGSQQTTAGDGQGDSSGDGQSSTESSESTNNSTDQQSTSDSSNDQQSTSDSSDEFAQASNRDGQGTRDSSQDQQSTTERSSDGDTTADGEQQPTGQTDAGQQPDTSQQPQAGTDRQSSSSPTQSTPDRAPQESSSTQPSTADQSAGDGGGEPDEVAEQSTEGREGARRPSDASPFGTLQPAALHDASMLQRIIAPTDQTAGAATGDLWSGLNSNSAPVTGLGDGPSGAQQPHSADQQLLAVGAGAVAAGLMLLAGGALLVALRRRSVPASRHPRA